MRFPLIGIIMSFIYLLLLEVFGITIINPFTPIMLCIIACVGIGGLIEVDDKDVFEVALIFSFSNSCLLMAAMFYGEYRISGCSLRSVFC